MTTEEERELCLNCRHTKRFHSKGSCSQPTCMCNCFIESGLIYTTDIFNSFEQGKSQATKEILEEVNKILLEFDLLERDERHTTHFRDGISMGILRLEELKQQLKKLGEEGS